MFYSGIHFYNSIGNVYWSIRTCSLNLLLQGDIKFVIKKIQNTKFSGGI